MDELVAEVALADVSTAVELLERLEHARAGAARVVLVTARPDLPFARPDEATLRALTLFQLPLIFAWEGDLAGPAADLALATDVRVCSAGSSLRGPLIGRSRAHALAEAALAEVLVRGERGFLPEELLSAGLVSKVTPPGGAHEEGRKIARVIASRGPIATRLAKEAIWRGLPQPFEQALRFETDLTLLLQTTKDRAEGVRAFLEKRPPIFTGE